MAASNVSFDVWVDGPSQPPSDNPHKRSELLRRIEAMHPVAGVEGAQFVTGGRLRVRRGIDHEAALRIVAELQPMGVVVAVEPHRPDEEAILALDQFQDVGPDAATGPSVDESMLARLATIDGDDTEAKARPRIDGPAATVSDGPGAKLAQPSDEDDRRFRPSHDAQAPVELQIDRPPPPPPAPPPPSESEPYPHAPGEDEAAAVEVEQPWRPIPGRIAQGALRKDPRVRIGIGVVLALGLGYVLAQPYAHRVERHAAELRAEADRERYRPVDEAQERVRQLDSAAEDASSSGAIGTAVIWLLVGGAVFAGWWRAT